MCVQFRERLPELVPKWLLCTPTGSASVPVAPRPRRRSARSLVVSSCGCVCGGPLLWLRFAFAWWLMLSSTFLCTYRPLIYVALWVVFSNVLPVLKLGCSPLFLVLSGSWSSVRYADCKYFSAVRGSPTHFFVVSLHGRKFAVLILVTFNWTDIFLLVTTFCVLYKKPLPTSKLQRRFRCFLLEASQL